MKPKTPEVKPKTPKVPMEQECDEEFLIAADLTLYANPMRCLQMGLSKTPPGQSHGEQSRKKAEDNGDIIAADLNKYGSPLDDLR
jgi:hypothetical protein